MKSCGVVANIIKCKNKRKVGTKLKIITSGCYILCEIKDDILYVINAKRR
ncbi:MAG: hypothetical protein QXR60_02585 [Candidatus Nanoarchaeia archaeon]